MIRKVIQIDRSKCNGCGACAAACHEGAIGMVDGKAELLREDYCDGLGDCLPACPTGAITFVEREAPAYDAAAVARNKARQGTGCPGSRARTLDRMQDADPAAPAGPSRLAQWPCQIKLVPIDAPYFDGADLLVAADCTAFAFANMHEAFLKGRITLIGCPKLDAVDYSEKLSAILSRHAVRSVTVVRMEVPCCGGLTRAVETSIRASGRQIPCRVVTVTVDGALRD